MMLYPGQHQINFDPEVRLPMMEWEAQMARPKPIDHSLSDLYHQARSDKKQGTLKRNIGGGAWAMYIGGIAVIDSPLNQPDSTPNTFIAYFTTAVVSIALSRMAVTGHHQAWRGKEDANMYAVHEIRRASREEAEPAEWAVNHVGATQDKEHILY